MAELISFVKPRQFLINQNSYKFYNLGTGFTLSKGSMELEMNIGLWSSVFLNHYIAGSGVRGVGAFEVGFDQNQPFQKRGLLCSVSPRLESELCCIDPFERDIAAVELFKSGEIFLRKGSALEELRTAYPYVKDVTTVANADEAKSLFKDVALQMAFKIPVGTMPGSWVEMIVKEGLSWNWFDGGLVLSNSKSAYYGIPPNFQHLALGRLELVCSDSGLCGSAGPPTVQPTPVVRKTVKAGDSWRKLISVFKTNPNAKTMTSLMSDLDAHAEFLSMGGRPEYNPGSRKKKWTTSLVNETKEVSQEKDGSCSFEDLVLALNKVSGEESHYDDLMVQFILLKKLAGQARIDHVKETIRY